MEIQYASVWEKNADAIPDQIALVCGEKDVSWKDFDDRSAKLATLLDEHGLGDDSKVGLYLHNSNEYLEAQYAVFKIKGVPINVNYRYKEEELVYLLDNSDSEALFYQGCYAEQVSAIKDKLSKVKVFIQLDDGSSDNLDFSVDYETSIQNNSPMERIERSGDNIYMLYTGGTTGVSKGAMLTHYNVLSNLSQIHEVMKTLLSDKKEICITALPLYHIFALVCNALVMFKMGAKNVLITNPRDMKGFVKELSKHKFSVITGVNTLFNGLINADGFKELDFTKLKVAFGGGMAVQKIVANKWKEITGSPLSEGYGLTETSPVVTMNPLDGTDKIGTIGLPLPSTNVKFVDDKNKEVNLGERGELCVKGPQVMKGYWQRQNETSEVMLGNWLKTGDIAIMDKDGFIKIVDRKKEMILVSGFNVFPNEVEHVISSHPKVLEVGVIGVPDKKTTEAVKAVVVKKDELLTDNEIIEHCKEKLTSYKCPKHVSFVNELPKSNVGKILRRIIKENDLKVNKY